EEIDRYILARYAQVATKMLDEYRNYNWAAVCTALQTFATVDLSAFYADVTKDRMYTFRVDGRERRSAQTTMYLMADGLTRLVAPVLSFTADEAWRFLPGARDESVHIAVFPKRDDLTPFVDEGLVERWTRLLAIREQVLARIEPLRKDKVIGSSLQAKVVLDVPAADMALLERYRADLPMLFIVSEVELRKGAGDAPQVTIERAGGVKCERCWRYVPAVSSEPAWAGICPRCQDALQPGDQAA
ncbi:MAG TPA: class I tRNA ligase family protein, partial [Vicinamibacterales bacterium]|nr:class I tRNA ligase family protein [Vicinamibacterales bacterium]